MKMRKLFAVILALVLSMSLLAGCGDTKEEANVTPQETAAETAAASETKDAPAAEAKSEAAPAAAAAESAPAEDVTAESLLQGYFDSAESVQSMSFNMLMDVAMKMAAMGQEEEMKMNMDVAMETYGDNAHLSGTMVSDTYGEKETSTVESYIMLEDGKYVSYSYDKDSESWSKSESDKPSISKEMIPKIDASKFQLEEDGGRYKISGSVEIKELIESMGDSFNELFSGFAGMDFGSFTGAANVEYYFNKDTKELEEVNIDMAEAFETIMKSMFAALFEGQDLGEEAESLDEVFSIEVGSFTLNLNKMLINQGKEIVLPPEAASATEYESVDIFNSEDDGDTETEELSVELAESFDFQDEYYKFSFNGESYEVNKTLLSEFLAGSGLELDEEDKDQTVEAGDTGYATIYMNDNYDSITLYLRNTTEEDAAIQDCVIYGMDLSTFTGEGYDCEIAGFGLGVTLDELIAKLGNPTYGYESDSYKSYSWEGENWDSIAFSFTSESDGATGMNVTGYDW